MKVVLLGYMASGKSSVGRSLASKLGYHFIDLDEEISNRVGMDVPIIFSEKGEIFFRRKEAEVLMDILEQDKHMVLSLGGGTPCYGRNMQIVNERTPYSFYLNLPIGSLVERISKEKEQRPLVARISDVELPEFIGKHLFERMPYYAQAHHSILANGKTVEDIANEISSYLV